MGILCNVVQMSMDRLYIEFMQQFNYSMTKGYMGPGDATFISCVIRLYKMKSLLICLRDFFIFIIFI